MSKTDLFRLARLVKILGEDRQLSSNIRTSRALNRLSCANFLFKQIHTQEILPFTQFLYDNVANHSKY